MHKPKLAMVDDEYDVLEAYKDLLSYKYNITEFTSPHAYLSFLREEPSNPFDLLITDYKMTSMHGIEMIQKAHEMGKDCPFILMSGFLDKEATLFAHNLGAHSILEKPVEVEVLDTEIRELVFTSQLQKLRNENKALTMKLKELCSLFDIFLEKYFTQIQIDEFFKQVNGDFIETKGLNFRDYVRCIEDRVQRNLKMEEVLLQQLKMMKSGSEPEDF